jgi:hypothetical protein
VCDCRDFGKSKFEQGWTVGKAGTAKLLKAGAKLRFQLHYTLNDTATDYRFAIPATPTEVPSS